MLFLLFAGVQIARVFYTYHLLQNRVRGGAGFLGHVTNVNYCDAGDATLADARNLIVYGNLQGEGAPALLGLSPDMIQILPERREFGTTAVTACSCTEETDSCNVSAGGHQPDFVVVNLPSGFPLQLLFPYVRFGTLNLKVSVRMPVLGD